ncbi:MAG: leucine-rich repeat domain-containing protein [Bacteroidaceae bacterium]|nr:leucine-rich repeat domain-containing protein [Bacteroidaceae bacterium]
MKGKSALPSQKTDAPNLEHMNCKRFVITLSLLLQCWIFTTANCVGTVVFEQGLEFHIDSIDARGAECSRLTNDTLQIVNIPDSVFWEGRAYPVISIGDSAFFFCHTVKKVVLPGTIESIGQYAFDLCSNLDTVIIPDNVSYIGPYAFKNCLRLKNVRIPSNVHVIETSVFYDCMSLEEIVIPEGVDTIRQDAFAFCGIHSIHIPASVRSIGSTDRPVGNTDVFGSCENLTRITVDKRNPTFDSRGHCNAIIVTSCNALISGCGNTRIPRTVEFIDQYAFCCRTNLKRVFIPKRTEEIVSTAFWGCDNLKKIRVSKRNPKYDSRDNCNAIICSEYDEIRTACRTTVIPASVSSIGWCAYPGYSWLSFLVLPDNITAIGESSFCGCKNLIAISLPDNLEFISGGAFNGCSALEGVIIPNGVKKLYHKTFKGCTNLKFVSLPIGIEVSSDAFDGCDINEENITYRRLDSSEQKFGYNL